ncbi:MAG: PQQ-binding-like beta-propeller repeat protein [Chloroherpetonaceae bacterium]|nr:PQQ-binding-like beta-propeller repeat protein [Chloroherpetonaceae bacterium]
MKKTLNLLILSVLCGTGNGLTQTVNENLWTTNGQVNAIAIVGDTAFIGGNFTIVGPASGQGVVLDTSLGLRDDKFPKVVGVVLTVVADGTGGWIIGGEFTAVGGEPRNRLARIKEDKTLDPTWNPNVNNIVYSLAISGSTVYAGGNFTTVNGSTPRNYLAAFDLTTGTATGWNPNANSNVYALAVLGNTVYAGGDFIMVNGSTPRNYLAAFDLTTGVAKEWNPELSGVIYPTVRALAISGNTVYAGGEFKIVNGNVGRNNLAAFDHTKGTVKEWNPNVSAGENYPIIRSLAVSGNTVYAGGNFRMVNGSVDRKFLAAFDTTNGTVKEWNPNVSGGYFPNVNALAVSGSTIYAGGDFTIVNDSVKRNYLAAFNTNDGTATVWNPNASGGNLFSKGITPDSKLYVSSLSVSGNSVYAGGNFTMVNSIIERNNLAAIDLKTGAVTSWNPNVNGDVSALAVSGSTLYAGGMFTKVNENVRRIFIAAIDLKTGTVTSWNPNVNGDVSAFAVTGSAVYAGGYFSRVNDSVARNNLAAFDLTTGTAIEWNPNVSHLRNGCCPFISALAVLDSTVYVGGNFTLVNGSTTRNNLAAFNMKDGTVTAWNPNVNNTVFALTVTGNTVYAGGLFTAVNGSTSRNRMAAFNTNDGTATVWNPNASGIVNALAVSGGTIYASSFNTLAAYDLVNGAAMAWTLNVNGEVRALAVSDNAVYAGGSFKAVKNIPQANFAGINTNLLSTKETKAIQLSQIALQQNYPNPFNPATTIQYRVPSRSNIELEVFDVLGRRVAILDQGVKEMGSYSVVFRASGVASGVYFYRLKSSTGFIETKKMILIK